LGTVLSALLEDSEHLIAQNSRPVPLDLNGVKMQIDDDDWLHLRETRSMRWLLNHLGHDEESWWLAVEQRNLHWFRVLGLPRFPSWQFRLHPHQPVDGLAEINQGFPARWDAQDIRVFMTSPHAYLAVKTTNYLSPAEWLGLGFSSAPVETILQELRMGPPLEGAHP
jgi:hypothetical protein